MIQGHYRFLVSVPMHKPTIHNTFKKNPLDSAMRALLNFKLKPKIVAMLSKVTRTCALYPIHVIATLMLLSSCLYMEFLHAVEVGDYSVSIINRSKPLPTSAGEIFVGTRKSSWSSFRWKSSASFDDIEPDSALQLKMLCYIHPDTYRLRPLLESQIEKSCFKDANQKCLVESLSVNNQTVTKALIYADKDSNRLSFPGLTASKAYDQEFEKYTFKWFAQKANKSVKYLITLVKTANSTDLFIMTFGYLTMHIIFVTLFINMRQLGSRIWLASSVLLTSSCAVEMAVVTAHWLGYRLNPILFLEGLPFLVILIGFEKPIRLSKAVMIEAPTTSSLPIPNQVSQASSDKGYHLVKEYIVEIVTLLIGAFSGVARLDQFCLLAALILIYDCIFLFTLYIALLTVKLEMRRMNRHADIRKALQEEGMSYKTAEAIAQANDSAPKESNARKLRESEGWIRGFGGVHLRHESVTKFKLFSVLAVIILSFLNFLTIPFKNSIFFWQKRSSGLISNGGLHNASNILLPTERLLNSISVVEDISSVIIYLKQTVYLELSKQGDGGWLDLGSWDEFFDSSFMRRWIFSCLIFSLLMNAYFFNAARWTFLYNGKDKLTEPHTSIVAKRNASRYVRKIKDGVPPGLSKPNDENIDGQFDYSLTQIKEHESLTFDEIFELFKAGKVAELSEEHVAELVLRKRIPLHAIEKYSQDDLERAVRIRRLVVDHGCLFENFSIDAVPFSDYDYMRVLGACCENVVGYIPIPVGVAGPLLIDGYSYYVPMATTEGALIASTTRGCKALNAAGGVLTAVLQDHITRGPCVEFPSIIEAAKAKAWIDSDEGQRTLSTAFNSTSRFARLEKTKTSLAGSTLFIRFCACTGDAMGMNMISKGVECALSRLYEESLFSEMKIISVSGNYCTDKKPAALNWIEGRGKSVVAEAIVPERTVREVLKSDVDSLVHLNISKNLVGSALAGSIGGFNAHAANVVTAVFIATGQDPAQNVESSQCMTLMKKVNNDLVISVTMPSIEVGTIGGGTILEAQSGMLDLLGVRGPHQRVPGSNAKRLAQIIAATVMAGELSLCAALASGHLVKSHLTHNRSARPSPSLTPTNGMSRTSSQLEAIKMR